MYAAAALECIAGGIDRNAILVCPMFALPGLLYLSFDESNAATPDLCPFCSFIQSFKHRFAYDAKAETFQMSGTC